MHSLSPAVVFLIRVPIYYCTIWEICFKKEVNALNVWMSGLVKNAIFMRNSLWFSSTECVSKSKKRINIHQTQHFFIKNLIAKYLFRLLLSHPEATKDCINRNCSTGYVILLKTEI
jgi:hypothetical protein